MSMLLTIITDELRSREEEPTDPVALSEARRLAAAVMDCGEVPLELRQTLRRVVVEEVELAVVALREAVDRGDVEAMREESQRAVESVGLLG
jgi:hypothetical protein